MFFKKFWCSGFSGSKNLSKFFNLKKVLIRYKVKNRLNSVSINIFLKFLDIQDFLVARIGEKSDMRKSCWYRKK